MRVALLFCMVVCVCVLDVSGWIYWVIYGLGENEGDMIRFLRLGRGAGVEGCGKCGERIAVVRNCD